MRLRPILAGAALALGAAAWLVDGLAGRGPAELAARVEAGIPRVRPLDLATRLRAREEGLRIGDVRSPLPSDALRLPRAEAVDLETLVTEGSATERWVLYDDGRSGDAAAAWVVLDAAGRDAWVLERGVHGWVEDVLEPVLPAGADSTLRAEFERVAELSRYFGGTPRVGEPGEVVVATWAEASPPGEAVGDSTPRRRGGCGW